MSRREMLGLGTALVATKAGLLVPSQKVLVPETEAPRRGFEHRGGFVTIPIENITNYRIETDCVEVDHDPVSNWKRYVRGRRRVYLTVEETVSPMVFV